MLDILKELISEKIERFEENGRDISKIKISSKEIYRKCREIYDENKCVGVATQASILLNRIARRIKKSRPAKWRITEQVLQLLFNVDYNSLRDKPVNELNDVEFSIILHMFRKAKVI